MGIALGLSCMSDWNSERQGVRERMRICGRKSLEKIMVEICEKH